VPTGWYRDAPLVFEAAVAVRVLTGQCPAGFGVADSKRALGSEPERRHAPAVGRLRIDLLEEAERFVDSLVRHSDVFAAPESSSQ
jgi:hypothetical protein